jgi:arginyl-tRNA synthetase
MIVRPIPDAHGVGYFSLSRLEGPGMAGYREQQVGRYWNYYVTPERWECPEKGMLKLCPVVDAFSPNLNKKLHIGHLRQLAIANSLQRSIAANMPQGVMPTFVALLGTTGILKTAVDDLNKWFDFLNYHPKVYYDSLMPHDADIVVRRKALMPCSPANNFHVAIEDAKKEEKECEVWDGPEGPVIVVRSDGRPTYAFHDLAFAKTVGPHRYITGSEQREHFKRLGLGDKHLPMGLVLGKNDEGKWEKMKSRTGDSFTAEEALEAISLRLEASRQASKHGRQTPYSPEEMRQLAWNVAAWNFLSCSREHNVKFDPDKWTDPNSGGLYITYTWARIKKALYQVNDTPHVSPHHMKLEAKGLPFFDKEGKPHPCPPDPQFDMTQADADLAGYGEYFYYYVHRAALTSDPAPLANYAHDLARKLGTAYHSEQISGGRYGFVYAVRNAMLRLGRAMHCLGMFRMDNV